MGTFDLNKLLKTKISNIEDFRKNQEALWTAINGCYLSSTGMLRTIELISDLTKQEVHRLMMWRTVLDYQMESFFLIIDFHLDEGLGLLRMASELTRDILRIGDDADKLELWLNRNLENSARNRYRKIFTFDESDEIENYVYKLYSISTKIGTHGHVLSSVSLKPVDETPDGKYLMLEVSADAMFRNLRIWLHAFCPIQELCARTFKPKRYKVLKEPYSLFTNMWKSISELLPVLRENLEKLNQ